MLSLDEIIARLTEIVGSRRVSTNPIDKINYQHTLAYGAYRALPDVIVRIESDANGHHKVADILRFANEHKIPIVAKGGVGMGISSPLKGGLLLDMLGMDKILEVNPALQYVIAEGGASVYGIHHALRLHGLMLPNFGTYGPAVVIGAMINKGGIGYGITRYGWIADMVLGLEVIFANGETIRLGALANQGTTFGPFQKWIHLPDLLGLFTLAAGSMGIISKVCLRAIEGRREWLHDYCYSFRRDQLAEAQNALMQLVKGEVVYDIHFTDRWQYHWPMEDGLYDKRKVPDDSWFFLKTMLMARDADELAFKEKRMTPGFALEMIAATTLSRISAARSIQATSSAPLTERASCKSSVAFSNLALGKAWRTLSSMREVGERHFAVKGTPTDCVIMVIHPTGGVGGGLDQLMQWRAIATKMGVGLRYESRVAALLGNDRRVEGVRVSDPNEEYEIRANSVILCAGGFQASAEKRARYLGANADLMKVRGSKHE